jgi:hypothetical protein
MVILKKYLPMLLSGLFDRACFRTPTRRTRIRYKFRSLPKDSVLHVWRT